MNGTRVDGTVAVVIGGGGGVGGGTALALAERSATVVVADIDPDTATATADQIVDGGGAAIGEQVDSTDDASLDGLFDRTVERHGRLDLLVNACGAIARSPVTEATDDEWGWIWELNVMSMIRSVRAALPHLRSHGAGGHIGLVSSLAGLAALDPAMTGGVDTGLYTTTKHTLVGYADMLRLNLADERIGVTAICPGLVEGGLGETSARHRPERFGGPFEPPGGQMPPGAMSRVEAGRRIVDAIEAGSETCFTHPEVFGLVAQAFERRRADAERAASD